MKSTEVVLVRVTPKEKTLFNQLAEYKDMSLSALIRTTLHNMAKRNKAKLSTRKEK